MNILYGVCGDGMGHATRSAVVAEHLTSRGHKLTFACSKGRAFDFLQRRWPGRVVATVSMNYTIVHNRVDVLDSFLQNTVKQAFAPLAHLGAFLSIPKPDIVISDFDAWSARYARVVNVPVVAVDNIHFTSRCNHAVPLDTADLEAAAIMYPVVEAAVPWASAYLVTTFASAPVCRDKTSLHLPILRPEAFDAKAHVEAFREGEHIVVYFNDHAHTLDLTKVLHRVSTPFRVYGTLGPDATEVRDKNVTFCPLSEANFLADVASARGVVGGSGFTLMTEAIYLGRPMLAVPFQGQFEQILNAKYLEALGYGRYVPKITEDALYYFLFNLDLYRRNLTTLRHDRNEELLRSVDRAIGAVS